jgi:hypothetical protein
MFRENLMTVQIEERATIQQAQGAARPIHTWPGDHAAELAKIFDEILEAALASFMEAYEKHRVKPDKKMSRISKIMRGQNLDAVLELESLQEDSALQALTPKIDTTLPTGPVQLPKDMSKMSAIEQLEALASLDLSPADTKWLEENKKED